MHASKPNRPMSSQRAAAAGSSRQREGSSEQKLCRQPPSSSEQKQIYQTHPSTPIPQLAAAMCSSATRLAISSAPDWLVCMLLESLVLALCEPLWMVERLREYILHRPVCCEQSDNFLNLTTVASHRASCQPVCAARDKVASTRHRLCQAHVRHPGFTVTQTHRQCKQQHDANAAAATLRPHSNL